MLGNNKPFIPKVSRLVTEATSTNDLAIKALAEQPRPDNGAVFRALAQTAGRGQPGNTWFSTPHVNLTFSVVSYPTQLPLTRLFALNQLASLAVADAVADCLPPGLRTCVRVKWPNDVYVNDRKIAGILIQNGLREDRLAWSVLGIGLNVNETAFPPNLAQSAVSLSQLAGRVLEVDTVLNRLLQSLQRLYPLTTQRALRQLDGYYHNLLYKLNETATFLHVATGRPFVGAIQGVTEAGELEILQPQGRISTFRFREVRLLQ